MQSRRYTVTVLGRLGERFRATFPGVSIEPEPGHSRLITEPFDQGQLHGLLNRVRDFGFDLLSVEAMPPVTDELMVTNTALNGDRDISPSVILPSG